MNHPSSRPRERRANTSRYAILGVLSFRPMSGYDVKKLIEQSIAHFWSESYGQIYPILNRLATEGLAERRRERQRGKPDRYVYSITPKGREELHQWLALPSRYEPVRSEILLRLFLGSAGHAADSIVQVEQLQAHHRGLLDTYERIERSLRKEMAGHLRLPFILITLRCGQHRSRAMLGWCEETLATLRRLDARPPRRAGR